MSGKTKSARREPRLGTEEPVATVSPGVTPEIAPMPEPDLQPERERALFAPLESSETTPLAPAWSEAEIHVGPLAPSLGGDIQPGPLEPAPDGEIHVGPLDRAVGIGEHGPASADAAPESVVAPSVETEMRDASLAIPAQPLDGQAAAEMRKAVVARRKKSWREQRWERRRRRIYFEEALGWVLVPIILIAVYLGVKGILAAVGTTPTALIQGIQTALQSRS